MKAKSQRCSEDLRWLGRAWEKDDVSSQPVGLFMETLKASGFEDTAAVSAHKACANQVVMTYRSSSLNTHFKLPSGRASISFLEVAGSVARDCLLNDSIVNTCIKFLCDDTPNSTHISSLFDDLNVRRLPDATDTAWLDNAESGDILDITTVKHIVFPINISNVHWVLLVVKLDYVGGIITGYMYDPLIQPCPRLDVKWEMEVVPFLRRWHTAVNDQRRKWGETQRMGKGLFLPKLKFPKVEKV